MSGRAGSRPDVGDMPLWLHETILVLCLFTATTSVTWLWALGHARGTGDGLDSREIGFLILHAVALLTAWLVGAILVVRKIIRARERSQAQTLTP